MLIGVANKLLGFLSKGLGLEEGEIKQGLGGEDLTYMLKINYYPPCPCPELALGVVPHTDMSSITILVPNEVQGLQVFKDGHWYDVAYIPNALIIHIGDQMEVNQLTSFTTSLFVSMFVSLSISIMHRMTFTLIGKSVIIGFCVSVLLYMYLF